MNIGKIAGMGVGATLTAGMFVNKLCAEYINGVDITDPRVSNELNRAWLMSESPNLDQFVREQKHVDLNKVYLCSDPDSY